MTKRRYDLRKDIADERDYKAAPLLKAAVAEVQLPSRIDLRPTCPPIYDQGQEGSCTANAGCANYSMLIGKPDQMFSRQFLYRMERDLEGTPMEDSGAAMRDICKALNKFGVCEEPFMPYTPANLFATPSAEASQNALNHRIMSYHSVANLKEIKQTLALKNKPVLLGMEVFDSMESQTMARTGVLPMPQKGEQNLGGHAVLVVGYVDGELPKASAQQVEAEKTVETSATTKILLALEARVAQLEKLVADLTKVVANFINPQPQPTPEPTPQPEPAPVPVDPTKGYLIIRNSWGSDWGQNGYFFMPYSYVLDGHAFDFWMLES
jgi:C1A family cysteine protease